MDTSQIRMRAERAGIAVRYLDTNERPYASSEQTVPLVFEARGGSSMDALVAFLRLESDSIRATLDDHGAILLRGFAIRSEVDFSRTISSIRGFHPMAGYFMAEPGRSLAAGHSNVFHTNTIFRTGGSFAKPGTGFHSENYYTADTPAFQSFWCKRRPSFGGETALVHMPRAYAELPASARAKLEAAPVCTPTAWEISSVAQRYGLSHEVLEQYLSRQPGIRIESVSGHRFVVMDKPIVFQHPRTGKRTFSANISGEIPELSRFMLGYLMPHYQSKAWALHRLVWKHARAQRLAFTIHNTPRLLYYHPERILRPSLLQALERRKHRSGALPGEEARRSLLVGFASRLDLSEVQALATAMWKNCSVFSWQAGDALIWDNMQMLHTGMPGLGRRELRVMLCNPVVFKHPVGSEVASATVGNTMDSLHAQLEAARNRTHLDSPIPGESQASSVS